jgi:flagellar hook-basal body complex protein FliE
MSLIGAVGSVLTGPQSAGLVAPPQRARDAGFGDALAKALQDVSDSQKVSGVLSKAFQLDNPTVSLEQVMLAGVKSQIAFQATLQVRNRVVQAYSEVMNMQI